MPFHATTAATIAVREFAGDFSRIAYPERLGTNATLWLESAEKIVETVAADLADCADRRKIFLTSAGVLPPPVSFDKARRVVEAFKRL